MNKYRIAGGKVFDEFGTVVGRLTKNGTMVLQLEASSDQDSSSPMPALLDKTSDGTVRFLGTVGTGSFGPLTQKQAESKHIPLITYPASSGWGPSAISAEDPRFTRWGGFNIVPETQNGFGQIQSLSGSFDGSYPFFREFGFDGDTIAIRAGVDTGKQTWYLWVEGELTSLSGYTAEAGVRDITLVFPSAEPRIISILACWGEHYITTGSETDTIWKVSRSKGRRAALITDSWGRAESDPLLGWPYRLALSFGYSDICPSMQGGTGYYNPGPAGQGRQNFSDRLEDQVLALQPDDVFIGGSINDLPGALPGVDRSAVKSNMRSVFSRIKSIKARLFVIGTQYVDPNNTVVCDAQDSELEEVLSEFGESLVRTKGWLTGEGKITSKTGTGNRDKYRLADGDHLNIAGGNYWANRITAVVFDDVVNAEI